MRAVIARSRAPIDPVLTPTQTGYISDSQQCGTEQLSMKAIKTYPTTAEADLARIALDAADVPSVVVGTGVSMEGGLAGVQLLVPDDQVDAALKVLGDA
jgi:Putative prokaryotic signal transducing protein